MSSALRTTAIRSIKIDTMRHLIYSLRMYGFSAGNKAMVFKVICLGITMVLCGSLFSAGLPAYGTCGIQCCCRTNMGADRHAPAEAPEHLSSAHCQDTVERRCCMASTNPMELPDVASAAGSEPAFKLYGFATSANDGTDSLFEAAGETGALSADREFRDPPLYVQKMSFII